MPYGDESEKLLKNSLLNDCFQRNHSLLYTGIFLVYAVIIVKVICSNN